jgi:hypothetical protein
MVEMVNPVEEDFLPMSFIEVEDTAGNAALKQALFKAGIVQKSWSEY